MTSPINLNKARKARAQGEAKAAAAANRVRFGRTKAEKAAAEVERKTQARALDGAERER